MFPNYWHKPIRLQQGKMRGGGSKISLSLLMVSEIRLQQPSCLLCLLASTEGHIQCLDCSNQLSQSNFLPFLLPKRLLHSNLLPPHPLSHIWPYVRFVSRKGNFRWDPHAGYMNKFPCACFRWYFNNIIFRAFSPSIFFGAVGFYSARPRSWE